MKQSLFSWSDTLRYNFKYKKGNTMIIDNLSELPRYISVLPSLETVHSILERNILLTQNYGSYKTDNPTVRYNLFSYTTETEQAKQFEIHKKEIDVQILIQGHERMVIADQESFSPTIAYEQEKDASFGTGKAKVEYRADTSSFALFFPGEPHCCNLIDGSPAVVTKVVFKILV